MRNNAFREKKEKERDRKFSVDMREYDHSHSEQLTRLAYSKNVERDLRELLAKSQAQYDKTLVALSSSALGVSLVFVRNFLSSKHLVLLCLMELSWVLFALSLILILTSHYTSTIALKGAIKDLYIPDAKVRKSYTVTKRLNLWSGIAFLIGIVFLVIFSIKNISEIVMSDQKKPINPTISVVRDRNKSESTVLNERSVPNKINHGTVLPQHTDIIRNVSPIEKPKTK